MNPTAHRSPFLRRLLILMSPLLAFTATLGVGAQVAHAQGGAVTGGSNFSNIVLELPQGGTVEDVYAMHVSNESDAQVIAQFQWSAPYGITLTPKQKDFTLKPGMRTSAPFNIAIADDTPGGEYEITTGIFRQDISSERNKVVFVPGVTQTFTIRVLGDAATANVQVVDKYKREPVAGLVSIARTNGSVRTEIARKLSDKFSVRAVPGTYEASVFLDGRRVAVKNFTLVKDQSTDVLIEVEAIFIREVALLPQKADGKLQTIQLTASIDNSLKPLPRARLVVDVLRNKKLLENIEIQKFAPLETGSTAASLRYVPKDGWKSGRYTFVVRLEAPEFTVKASNTPSYSVGGAVVSPLGWILGALGLIALIVAIAIAVRRRKKDAQRKAGRPVGKAPAKAKREVTKATRS